MWWGNRVSMDLQLQHLIPSGSRTCVGGQMWMTFSQLRIFRINFWEWEIRFPCIWKIKCLPWVIVFSSSRVLGKILWICLQRQQKIVINFCGLCLRNAEEVRYLLVMTLQKRCGITFFNCLGFNGFYLKMLWREWNVSGSGI